MKGTLWVGASRVLTNIIGFLSTLILARILTPDDFGLVALGITMLAILNAITNLSLASALIQHREPTEAHLNTAWTLNLVRAVALGLILCAAAYPAAQVYKEPRLLNVMYALSAGVLLSGLSNPRTVMLLKDLIFWQYFVLQISQRLVTFIVSVGVALLYRSYWALIAGTLAGHLIVVLASYMVLPFRPKIAWLHWRELWSFSIWLTLGQIVNTLNWKFDHLLIGGYLGRPSLGYYTVGDHLAVLPTRESTVPLTQPLFPAFAKLAGDPLRLATAYQSAQSLVTAVALPIGVGVALIADPLVRLTMGEKWLPAVIVIQVLASIFALQTLATLAQPLGMAAGRTKLLFRRDVQSFAMRLPLIIIGMYLGGLTGIVYARALTGLIAIGLNMNVVKMITGLSPAEQVRVNLRSLVSVAIMSIAVVLAGHIMGTPDSWLGLFEKIVISIAIGGVFYFTPHYGLWAAMGHPKGPETQVIEVVRTLSNWVYTLPRKSS